MNKAKQWTLQIPATSGNMGPGFDSFGLALSLYNLFSWHEADEFSLSFNGPVEIAADSRDIAKNYVVRSYKNACSKLDISPRPWAIHSQVNIPLRGGMGSSGTAIVAGCAAALLQKHTAEYGVAEINDEIRHSLLQMASEMEKHPDNVAASIYGGFVISRINEAKEVTAYKFASNDKIKYWVIMPQVEVSTDKSRNALASLIPRELAVFNITHAALTAVAFATQKYSLLKNSMDDKIHEKQRDTIYNHSELKKKLLAGGALGVCLSGSGPAILMITKELTAELKNIAKEHFKKVKVAYTETLLSADNKGITLEYKN